MALRCGQQWTESSCTGGQTDTRCYMESAAVMVSPHLVSMCHISFTRNNLKDA